MRIGTRGSPLALAQTNQVAELIEKIAPRIECEVVRIRTKGDANRESGTVSVESKSSFTLEIEESLLNRKIDLAVHSMKDLTTDLSVGLKIAAVPERSDSRDVFISRKGTRFQELPTRARIGTSSPRRKAQLLAARRNLEIIETRGNVDTRLRKLESGDYDGIVLAAAGLIRLGMENHATEYLSIDVMLPAVGQGALAIETREDDEEIIQLLSTIDHESTHVAVDAERAFARRLGADCRTPVAAYAKVEFGKLTIDGMAATTDAAMLVRSRIVTDNIDATKAGEDLAESLLSKGASAILEAA